MNPSLNLALLLYRHVCVYTWAQITNRGYYTRLDGHAKTKCSIINTVLIIAMNNKYLFLKLDHQRNQLRGCDYSSYNAWHRVL